MNLRDISKTVENVCLATSAVLNVDVIVVDSNLNTINSTYKYLGKYDINIHDKSNIAICIQTKKPVIVQNIDENKGCAECANRDICKIKGLIAMPIICDDVCVGGIEFMFIKPNLDFKNPETMRNIQIFLEHMAGLLSSKLSSVESYKEIEIANLTIRNIINNVDAGIVFLDNSNSISFCNETFMQLFNTGSDVNDRQLYNFVNHRDINQFLLNHKEIVDSLMVFNTDKYDFNAVVNCVTVNYNSEMLGSLISFRRIDSSSLALNKILRNTSTITFDNLAKKDPAVIDVVNRAKEYAITDSPVLISGNKGVGKESLAYCMHNFSKRKNNSVVIFQCRFLPRAEYLSKLFGIGENYYAYGKLQLAAGGTLILYEIENMPINIQMDLLNLLTNKVISLENGFTVSMPDVRLICTTTANLETRVMNGEFLEELYYRLKIYQLHVNDFAERDDEAKKAIIKYYADAFGRYLGKSHVRFSDESIKYLSEMNWKNNLVTLEKFIEKIIYRCEEDVIELEDFVEDVQLGNFIEDDQKIRTIEELEKKEIIKAFNIYKGEKKSVDIIARKLGLSRATLYRKLHNYGIEL